MTPGLHFERKYYVDWSSAISVRSWIDSKVQAAASLFTEG
jgi:hypothetical protein